MPESNPTQSQPGKIQNIYYLLGTLVILSPIAYFFYYKLDLQDIYWRDQCPALGVDQTLDSTCYQILNNSIVESPFLMFVFTVNVPKDKIRFTDDINESKILLGDPNNHLIIDIRNCQNMKHFKSTNGSDGTIIGIEFQENLGLWRDFLIRTVWSKGRNITFTNSQLYSGTQGSVDYRVYPQETNRRLLAQLKWQLFLFAVIAAIVILSTIAIRWRLNIERDLLSISSRLLVVEERFRNASDTYFNLIKSLLQERLADFDSLKRGTQAAKDFIEKVPKEEAAMEHPNVDLPVQNQIETTYEQTIRKAGIKLETQNPTSDPPLKAGKKWDPLEDKQLIKEFKSKTPIDEIAKNHGRTAEAIRLRLKKLLGGSPD